MVREGTAMSGCSGSLTYTLYKLQRQVKSHLQKSSDPVLVTWATSFSLGHFTPRKWF